jgi:hypothetical protein
MEWWATFTKFLPFLLTIEDAFCKFWAFQVLGVLVSGLPGNKRNREIEYVNKSVVFKLGGPKQIKGTTQTDTATTTTDKLSLFLDGPWQWQDQEVYWKTTSQSLPEPKRRCPMPLVPSHCQCLTPLLLGCGISLGTSYDAPQTTSQPTSSQISAIRLQYQ